MLEATALQYKLSQRLRKQCLFKNYMKEISQIPHMCSLLYALERKR